LIAEVARLRAAGHDIVGLEGGEPGYDTPEHARQAAVAALDAGYTRYTAVDGTPSLKQSIIDKFDRENGLRYEFDQILVTCGAKQAFYNLCQALLNSGDEVIVPAPYWTSYPDMALLADAKPVIVFAGMNQGFKITAQQLAAAITSRTRLLVLNSPSNPTGAVYDQQELRALGDIIRRYPHVMVASDDIYERICLDEQKFDNLVTACPDLYERVFVINGVSKSFSMTGWRIGYAAGPRPLIAAMKTIQSQSTSSPTSISQYAAEAALSGDQACVQRMNAAFRERHGYLINMLNRMNGVRCIRSAGAFYAFPNVSGAIREMRLANDLELSRVLMKKARVAVVPGSVFGAEGFVRISFATDMESLKEGVRRIGDFLGWRESSVADREAGDTHTVLQSD
jgi:aspartate aminotransferase